MKAASSSFPRVRWWSVLVLVLSLGFVAGFWMPQDDLFFAIKKNLTIFGTLYEELSVGYVDDIDPERMMRTGIDAMMETLDPYTVFIDEADNEEIDMMTSGRHGDVGLNIRLREDGRATVTATIEGYSGFKQGVRAGDILTHIDQTNLQGLTAGNIHDLLRGDPGSTVAVRILREGEAEAIDFVLTRADINIKDVTFQGLLKTPDARSVGYVRLERFSQEATPETRQAIQNLRAQGNFDGFILDLRNNPGGLLDAAVDITGLFVEQGAVVVSTRGRLPQTERVYRSRRPPVLPNVPLVILVNESSASASEIVAGAVQDLDRGVILGEQTFGKGLVQIVRPLPYNTSLKMTTSKYYTPSGRSIQAIHYTHQAQDGYAVEIADSLRGAFQTSGGRTVRDGGGIEPDQEVAAAALSELEAALVRKSAFFLYANAFAAKTPTIEADFTVNDAIYADFRAWLREAQFVYRTRSERMIDALSDGLTEAGYASTADEIETLRTEVDAEKEDDFRRYADALKERIRIEILARYFGNTAQIEASLTHDPQVQSALVLMDQPGMYVRYLSE